MYADTSPFDRRRESTDWSESYQNHPAVFLGLAVGIGVVLGVLKARRSYQPAHDEPVQAVVTPGATPKPPLRERSPKFAQLMNTWEQITDALLGVATARAVDAIAERLPGFKDQYERQSAMRGDLYRMDAVRSGR